MLQDLLKGIISLLFPRNCALCRRGPLSSHELVCLTCFNKIPRLHPPTIEDLGPLDQAWCVCRYKPPLTILIHQFKYRQTTRLRHVFNGLLTQCIDSYELPIQEFDYIIPMPLHPQKYRERGFNQAQLLAESLSKRYHIPLNTTSLSRAQPTTSQTNLSVKERWTNQEGTFRITQSKMLTGKKVLLVDDIMTSGATAHTAAFMLKKAGAQYVCLITIAKT